MGAVALHLWHPPSALREDNPNWGVIREVERTRRVRSLRGLNPTQRSAKRTAAARRTLAAATVADEAREGKAAGANPR